MLQLTATLNAMDAGAVNPAEAEDALRGPEGELFAWVKDPDRLMGMSHRLTLRIGMAQVPRRFPGPWMVAVVAPGRLTGLRGPAELTRAALSAQEDPALGAVAVAVRQAGTLAWTPALEPEMGVGAIDAGGLDDEDHLVPVLRLRHAERPLPPATPSEAAHALTAAMNRAAGALQASGFTSGQRPGATGTVRLGPAYGPANQRLLDQALTMLAVVAAGQEQNGELPHSHAIATRAAALAPLRTAALDAVSAAVSWPTHAMQ